MPDKQPEEERIELRSEEVQEILGTPPRWIVRWGTTLAFFVLMMLLFVGWIVKYPDIKEAHLRLTTSIPPSPLVARIDGNIDRLFVSENDSVPRGYLLAVIQSTSHFEDVLWLDEELTELKDMEEVEVLNYNPDRTLVLGELQGGYSALIENFEAFNRDQNTDYTQQSVARIAGEKEAVASARKADESKLLDLQQELVNAMTDQERIKKLFRLQIKSKKDLENAHNAVLAVKNRINQTKATIANKRQQLLRLENEILTVENNREQSASTYFIKLREDAHRLQSAIQSWKQRYLLYAPIEGTVAFQREIKEYQFVQTGDLLMRIIPKQNKEWIGQVKLPTTGSGKVEAGQRVVVKFDNYPHEEHGVVEGVVRSKSLLPNEHAYNLEVAFPNGMVTSYNNNLSYKPEMEGKAEIITDNKRLLEWLFEKLLSRFRSY